MDYCGPRGIPHSEFLAWSTSDRDKALWWLLIERETCQRCGTRDIEWDPKRGGHRRAYFGRFKQCEGCVVLERVEAAPEMTAQRGMKAYLARNPQLLPVPLVGARGW